MADYNFDPMEKKLKTAVPWVGYYIATSSAVCTLAMAADAFSGFRRKRLWFPCKYFSLNATSLTLLGVAMKLPVDLNTNMYDSPTDMLAKYGGILFISTAMANFMASLGSMTDKEILANVLALGILVITIAANVFTQLILLRSDLVFLLFICMAPTILMLRLLVKLVSVAVMVPTIKRRLEAKYQEQHKMALREEEVLNRRDAFQIENLRRAMMKYWVMAETSNPQFVMSRSVVFNTAICFLTMLTLVVAYVAGFISLRNSLNPRSVYERSTIWILVIQSIGVVVGTIAPTLRWFAVVSFKCTAINYYSFKRAFKVETHWTQILVDFRDSFSGLRIRKDRFRRFLHDAKWYAVTFCIGLQILTLQLSKLFVFVFVLLTSPFFVCFFPIKIFMNRHSSRADDNIDPNLDRYVLLLEGEPEPPTRVLKNMCHEANKTIQTGGRKQPRSLLRLLGQFVNFNGVAQFDSNQIPSLHSQEPPNCWTLPVVTLTSIAIALPHIAKHESKRLLRSVSEGLSLAKIVEKTLYENAQLANVSKAANICWAGVLLYTKWLGINLNQTSVKCKNSEEVLQLLSKKAEEIIMEFKKKEKDPIMENPLNWPAKVVAANSMYRISRTILSSSEDEQTDERLFERISVMIADILAACLTNLARAITTMCHRDAIEKREENVQKAFLLLGETEQVIELLQKKEWPYMDHDRAAYIDEWCALFLQNHDDAPATSTSYGEMMASSMPSEDYLATTVDC